jgi:hypothetical protein
VPFEVGVTEVPTRSLTKVPPEIPTAGSARRAKRGDGNGGSAEAIEGERRRRLKKRGRRMVIQGDEVMDALALARSMRA